ncbi:hypothetical protein OKW23_001270 [Bacilli bacterium PM5-9]|nr:hypothetical protein [Bacilli bacterium PM5-9]
MNPKVQLENLKREIEWMLQQAISTKQTFNATFAVSEVFAKTNALAIYGDYFAFSQNVMISDIQLQLSKLYVENADSITLSKSITLANDLFTEKYYKEKGNHALGSYADLKNNLDELNERLNELTEPIKNLKLLRDKNLAHFDKKIKNYDDLDILNQSNPVFLKEAILLINFVLESLCTIKSIVFNTKLLVHHKDYTHELEQIAKAIEFYKAEQDKKRGEMIGASKY